MGLPRTGRARGRVLTVVGPDGTGKSTLVTRLIEDLSPHAPVVAMHSRPSVLPRRSAGLPATEPHAAAPYSPVISRVKCLYLFCDFWLGWITKVRPIVRRGGMVIFERGWWDQAVDPLRYRLRPGRLVPWLGRLIPRMDLVAVLHAPPEIIRRRKPELDVAEIRRQMGAWTEILPAKQDRIELDATLPVDELSRKIVARLKADAAVREH